MRTDAAIKTPRFRDEQTQTGDGTLTIELDMNSFCEKKSLKIAIEAANRMSDSAMGHIDDHSIVGENLSDGGERRRHNRRPSKLPVLARAVFSGRSEGISISGFLTNVSLSGMGLISAQENLEKGDVFELEMMDGMIPFSVTALVVKKISSVTSMKPQYHYGMRIIRMSPQSKSSIERLIVT